MVSFSVCNVVTSHTAITCSGCPAGTGGDHHLIATVAGLTSESFPFTYACMIFYLFPLSSSTLSSPSPPLPLSLIQLTFCSVCDPMCIFGECVDTNVCKCDDGYGGIDCSAGVLPHFSSFLFFFSSFLFPSLFLSFPLLR